MFLVRDWNYPDDNAYGLQGGQKLLSKVMKIKEQQLLELKSLRQYIYGSFDNISCFLMPYPGGTVATKKTYDGRWSLIDKEFVDNLKDLAEALLSPKNLFIKKINDQDLQVNEFYIYIDQYIKMFSSKDLPKPQSIYEATVTNHMQILIAKSLLIYNQFVQIGKNNLTEIPEINLLHNQAKIFATQKYIEEKKMGTSDHDVTYKNLLLMNIKESFTKWKPTAVDYIKKLQENKRKLEINAELVRQAQAKADETKKAFAKTFADLQKANDEIERVKHESNKIKAEAKQFQTEAQIALMKSTTLHKDALKQAEQRELEYKAESERFKAKFRMQNEEFEVRIKSVQNELEAANGESTSDKFLKWIMLGLNTVINAILVALKLA